MEGEENPLVKWIKCSDDGKLSLTKEKAERTHFVNKKLSEQQQKIDEEADKANAEGGKKGHPNFRIFLSAEPHLNIPIGLLQRSIKITAAAPRGLKANLQ